MSEAVLKELRLLREKVDKVEELLETVLEVLTREDELSEDEGSYSKFWRTKRAFGVATGVYSIHLLSSMNPKRFIFRRR